MLIALAYSINHFNIWPQDDWLSGGPAWLNSDRYDVQAKMDSATVQELQTLSPEQRPDYIKSAIQSLLAERFDLKVSREVRNLPVYALVVAKGGPRLSPSTVPAPDTAGPHPPKAGLERGPVILTYRGQIEVTGMPIAALVARALARTSPQGDRSDGTDRQI